MNNVIIRYFGAKWCGPCKQYKPVIEKLQQNGLPITFHDIDEDPIMAESHRIQSVPQIKIEVDGEVKESMIGIQPLEVLLGKIGIYHPLPTKEKGTKKD